MEEYICGYCQRPVITDGAKGEADGPTVRPEVAKWCTGSCDSIIGLFDIFNSIIEKKQWERIPKIRDRIRKDLEELLVERDSDHKSVER